MKLLSIVRCGFVARLLFIVFGLPFLGAIGVTAQEPAGDEHRTWLTGGSVGMPAVEGGLIPELLTVGVHWTQFRPGQLGADFWLGTIPRAFPEGVVAVGARGGVALPLALAPALYLVPSGGVSLLGGVSSGGAGGETGLNAGIAAAILKPSSMGLRAGATWHRFRGAGGAVWLWEVGLVRRQ